MLSDSRIHISQQTLTEVSSTFAHPRKLALPPAAAIEVIEDIASVWTVHQVTAEVVVAGLHAVERWGISFYDAQLWAAAALNKIPVMLSEEFPHGLVLDPVLFLDPFCDEFDPAVLAGE